MIEVARAFLKQLDLSRFSVNSLVLFEAELDLQTESLRTLFPERAQHWGSARKAVNLFLGEVYYHRVLCPKFGFENIAGYLEVPLDSLVGTTLRSKALQVSRKDIPVWPGLKYLTSAQSTPYQGFAQDYSSALGPGWERVHLDLLLWSRKSQ